MNPERVEPDAAAAKTPVCKKRPLAELLEAAATRPALDAEETGAFLGIGTSTAYRLMNAGVIPCFRIPGTAVVRVRRTVLENVLRSWEQGGRRRKR